MSSIFLIVSLVVTLMHNISPSILSKDSWQILFLTPISLFFFVLTLSILKIGEAFTKIIGVFLSSYYILLGFSLQVLIVSKINTVDFGNLFVIFFIFISSLILLMIIVFKSLEHYFIDKLLIIIFGFAIYSIIIFDGNFIFFIYYADHSYLNQETINDFKNIKGQLDILKILCSTTMSKFFNYPSDPKLPLSYYLPYFIGKLADLFVLGYVFSKITSSESRKVLVKK